MPTFVDLTGQKFGQLTVLQRHSMPGVKNTIWLCQCECGARKPVNKTSLKQGAKSCGGYHNRVKHGKAGTRIYKIWTQMLSRCNVNANPSYKNYGGRGIKVCDRWRTFDNFYADMGDKPSEKTLERKNNDGDYEPSNCVWAIKYIQSRNMRSNVWLTYGGKTMILTDWRRQLGWPVGTFYKRMKNRTFEQVMRRWAPEWKADQEGLDY